MKNYRAACLSLSLACTTFVVWTDKCQGQEACYAPSTEPIEVVEVANRLTESCYPATGPSANQCSDTACLVDVVVVYTAAAAALATAYGQNIVDEIYRGQDAVNEGFQNGGIGTFLRIVAVSQVDYDESQHPTKDEILGCLATPTCMPQAHAVRDAHKADLVSLYVATHQCGGLGQVEGPFSMVGYCHPNFTVLPHLGYYVFAHEIGHNFGSCHDTGIVDSCVPAYSYCRGYVGSVAGEPFTTHVTYAANQYTIPYYSNPFVLYQGVPAGNAASGDQARCFGYTAGGLARLRISDCNLNEVCDSSEILAGTVGDCNHNDVPDICESQDCDGDGIFNICETPPLWGACCLTDCNNNGLPDECGSGDCDGDGVLDVCESPGVWGSCCIRVGDRTYCQRVNSSCDCDATYGAYSFILEGKCRSNPCPPYAPSVD